MTILGITASSIAKASGAFESIATFSPTSGTSVTFSSIPQTYQHLHLRLMTEPTSDAGLLVMQFNGANANQYISHYIYSNGSTTTSDWSSLTSFIYLVPIGGFLTSSGTVNLIDIHDYANTSRKKTVRIFGGGDQGTAGRVGYHSGHWNQTSAISSITIYWTSVQFQIGTTISLYGIKGA